MLPTLNKDFIIIIITIIIIIIYIIIIVIIIIVIVIIIIIIIITTVNKNQIYSIYPMFIFLNKLSEDTASIFKFTTLTLLHKNDCKIF